MTPQTAIIIIFLFRMFWFAAIVGGTAYIVFWLGYSGWWWLLAIVLLMCFSGGDDEKNDTRP